VLDSADSAGGQKGSEEEVVARGDDDDIVVFRVELLQQRDGAPAGTCRVSDAFDADSSHSSLLTQDDERLLAWVRRRLVGGVASLVDAVSDVSQASDGGEVREAPCPAQEAEPLGLRLRRTTRLLADRLAKGNLVLRRSGSPSRSVGDKRRALSAEGPASSQLNLREHIGSGERPHVGCHCNGGSCGRASRNQWLGISGREGEQKVLRVAARCAEVNFFLAMTNTHPTKTTGRGLCFCAKR
jgi:hypothetical protein